MVPGGVRPAFPGQAAPNLDLIISFLCGCDLWKKEHLSSGVWGTFLATGRATHNLSMFRGNSSLSSPLSNPRSCCTQPTIKIEPETSLNRQRVNSAISAEFPA